MFLTGDLIFRHPSRPGGSVTPPTPFPPPGTQELSQGLSPVPAEVQLRGSLGRPRRDLGESRDFCAMPDPCRAPHKARSGGQGMAVGSLRTGAKAWEQKLCRGERGAGLGLGWGDAGTGAGGRDPTKGLRWA